MTTDAEIVIGIKGQLEGGKRIKRTLDDIANSGDKATKSTENLEKQVKRTSNAGQLLSKAFSVFVGGVALSSVVKTTDEFILLEARIKNSTDNVQEFDQALRELRQSAADTGAEFATSVEIFQRISFVREEINASVGEMTRFTDSVQKLGVVSGASTQGLNAGLRQLGQSLSSEIVRAEEFNSIMENIPAVGRAIADELGVTTGQLRQLVIDGELLSSDVFAAILNQTEEINAQFDKFPVTIGRALNEFILKLQSSANEVNKVAGGTQIVIEAFRFLGLGIESIVGLIKGFGNTIKAFFSLVIAGIIDAFNAAARQVETFTNFIIDNLNKINPGEAISRVSFAPDISRSDLASAAAETASQELEAARKGFIEAFDKAGAIFTGEKSSTATSTVETETRKISKNYAEIAKQTAAATGNIERSRPALEAVAQTTPDISRDVEKISKETDRFANSAADAFGEFVTGAKSAKEALSDLIGELANLVLRETVTGPLSNGIKGLLNGATSGGSGGNIFGSLFSSIGGSLGSIGSLFGFNSGGSMILGGNAGVDQNVLSLNGLPIASTGRGEVLSISPTSNSSQPVVVNQTINVSTGVRETVRAEIVQLMPQIRNTTQAAIQEAQLRGIS